MTQYVVLIDENGVPYVASGGGAGDASAANQTAVQAVAGSNATKAIAVQGIDGGKDIPTKSKIWDGTNSITLAQYSATILGTQYAIPTNTVIHGESTAGGGSYVGVKVSPSGSIQIGGALDVAYGIGSTNATTQRIVPASDAKFLIDFPDNSTRDAFGNLRMVLPHNIFASKQIADAQPLLFDDQQVSGTATSAHQANQASTLMSVTGNVAGKRVRQSKRWMNYQSGKSQKVTATFVLGTAGTGITRRVGLFNDDNGLFLEEVNGVLSMVVRSKTSGSVVDTKVAQANWNRDKFNGTGDSGITFDQTKIQILDIDFQWLSAGRVRFGFSLNGTSLYAQQTSHANFLALPYMSTPNLPCRCEIESAGTGAATTYTYRDICWSVSSEGGEQNIGIPRTLTRGATPLVTLNDTSLYPLIAFRLRTGYLHSAIDVLKYSISCTSAADYEYQLIVNPTVTGTAFSFTTLANSGVEYDVSRLNTTTVSGGDMIADAGTNGTAVGSISSSPPSAFKIGSKIDGTSDIVVLAVRRLTGTTETFYSNLVFSESV